MCPIRSPAKRISTGIAFPLILVKRSNGHSANVAFDAGEQLLRVGADGADSGHGPVGGDETLKLARSI